MKGMFGKFSVFLFVMALLVFLGANPMPSFAAKPDGKTKAAKAKAAEPAGKLTKANEAYDADKMGDMSDYDPSNPIVPTGDTIKIAVVASFSGVSAANGAFYWNVVQWVAHDINKRGGILVDGKKKAGRGHQGGPHEQGGPV